MKRGFVGAILAGICVVLGVAVAYVSSKQDRTDPVITVSEDALTYTEGEGTEGLLTGVTASDKEDGDLTKNIFVEKVVPISENKAIVYYGVLDKSQNVGTATKEVEYFPAGQQPYVSGAGSGSSCTAAGSKRGAPCDTADHRYCGYSGRRTV